VTGATGTRLAVLPLSAEAFAPYGRVVEPGGEPDATGPGWRWWGETASLAGDGRPWGIGLLALTPAERRFDWAERHLRSEELVLPAVDCLVYVGPADPAGFPALDAFRVFHVPSGSGVVIAPGVWHGAPMAVDAAGAAVVLLLQGTGRDDTDVVRFEATPVTIT
jgi:ureidoglycolate lyase